MIRLLAVIGATLVVASELRGGFPLIADGEPSAVWVDHAAPAGVERVAGWFADDLRRVSGKRPSVARSAPSGGRVVIVGVVGSGGDIDALVAAGELDVSSVRGKGGASVTAAVGDKLVVAGGDKRGAIYGLLDLSREIGVSPWYWWADAPVQRRSDVAIAGGPRVRPPPKVRYRGVFLNDEAPALSSWARQTFGGFNSRFYAKVYELLLRLRGNFLWPAMWGSSLFDDDPLSQPLADELGIVIGTSHHEPMQRAHTEWSRYGSGPWDYGRNSEALRAFWRDGVRRMGDKESVVTLGMRGDGDMPMSDRANIGLLERIVRDQRRILAEELDCDPTSVPQVWALYKEVQEYYDRGMSVPDDVTLLLCDDNWGNVRRLPHPDEPRRAGGYGVYYHYDYVGDPRNYKWINTNALPRVWEQMHLCWEHGVDRIWVVNVGDLKPMEEPIDFFLSMAYDPDAFPAPRSGEAIDHWRTEWAAEQFGEEHAAEIASVLRRYAKYAARRKPEFLTSDSYSLSNYEEWDRVLGEWRALVADAESIEQTLPGDALSAYYQLVLHEVLAFGNLHEMYYAVAKNREFAAADDPRANRWADTAERCFARDAELTNRYHSLSDGKWNHMMVQTHIGYTSWRDPREQSMPEVRRIANDAAEGTEQVNAMLPPSEPADSDHAVGYVESENHVSVEAAHFSDSTVESGVWWQVLSDHGRTGSAVTTVPVTAPATLAGEGPCLEYPIWLSSEGPVEVDAYLSPTHDFYGRDDHGIRFAVSIDDAVPVVVDMHADRSTNEHNANPWRRRVSSAIHVASTPPIEATPGAHTLKFWRVDNGLVLQKLVVRTGPIAPSYLGPPESRYIDRE